MWSSDRRNRENGGNINVNGVRFGGENNLNVRSGRRWKQDEGGEKGRKNGYGNVPFHDSLKRFPTPFPFLIKRSFFSEDVERDLLYPKLAPVA